MDLSEGLSAYARRVDSRLSQLLPTSADEPKRLHEAMRYALLAPGKRIRPVLCMESARAIGADPALALDAGCALEMVHCFSLIHDDLPAIDNDDMRRGRPTVHVAFGEATAILAGDALFALAFEVMARCSDDPTLALAAVAELAVTSGTRGLVGGELMDIEAEGVQPSADLLQQIHHQKTAVLMGCSCVIGGILGGGKPPQVEALRRYGIALGLAFQVYDDILNVVGDPETLGKSAGSDAERGKMTFPAVYGLAESRKMAEDLRDQALIALRGLPGEATMLAQLAHFVVNRES